MKKACVNGHPRIKKHGYYDAKQIWRCRSCARLRQRLVYARDYKALVPHVAEK